MVKVFYGFRTNARLGGVMFYDGVAEFEDIEEGIRFAEMFYKKYEIVEATKPKTTRKRKSVS